MYDYLIAGAGLYGAVFAQRKTEQGFRCLVVDRREHIGGNAYTETVEGIAVHRYGPHIFHTGDEAVWAYVNRFASFNHFIYAPIANYRGTLYNLPFNMNTFNRLWGVTTPAEARAKIDEQVRASGITEPRNLEEQAIALVGTDLYEILVKGYTEKQWGRPCRELPPFIIRRLPVRLTFDNNYFNDPHQGIPKGGYTRMAAALLEGAEVQLGTDCLKEGERLKSLARKIVFTGPIDEYYGYRFGALEYRSLRFETRTMPSDNYQGAAGINYTDAETPYTRSIEHKHFTFGGGTPGKTVVTREYSQVWTPGAEPYYPVNDGKNTALYRRYAEMARSERNLLFGGRLGTYRYLNMDQVIKSALTAAEQF